MTEEQARKFLRDFAEAAEVQVRDVYQIGRVRDEQRLFDFSFDLT